MTLHDVLQALEDEDNPLPNYNEINIVLQPPINYCQDLTDEDSCDEDIMNINNLPGTQLRAETEIIITDDAGEED